MRLDSSLIALTLALCTAIGTLSYGLLFQSTMLIIVAVFAFRNTKSGTSTSATHQPHLVPPFRVGAVGLLLVPLMLVAEKIHGVSHSVGFSSLPLYSSLLWAWCSMMTEAKLPIASLSSSSSSSSADGNRHFHSSANEADDEDSATGVKQKHTNKKKESPQEQQIQLIRCAPPHHSLPLVADRNRFEHTVLYTVTGSLAFLMLTLNLHVGAGMMAFIGCAYATEILLRYLFHSTRISLRRSQFQRQTEQLLSSCPSSPISSPQGQLSFGVSELEVVDTEIHLVSTLVGWVACDCASNPVVPSSASSGGGGAGATGANIRTVVSATSEMVVGRSMLFAAWLVLVVIAVMRIRFFCNKNNNKQQKDHAGGGDSKRKSSAADDIGDAIAAGVQQPSSSPPGSSFFSWMLIIGAVAAVSLALTGWQCSECFLEPDELAAVSSASSGGDESGSNQNNANEIQLGLSIQQRIKHVSTAFKKFVHSSMRFQNPLKIWYRLIFTVGGTLHNDSKNSNNNNIVDDQQQQAHHLPLRVLWMLVWAASIPLLSAVPIICAKLHPAVHRAVPRIIWRKWFHLVAVAAFVVATLTDAPFMAMAWSGALALTALVEAARYCDAPPFHHLTPLLESSVIDDRDAVVLRTHWYLMLGCALPLLVTQRCNYFWSDSPHWLQLAALRVLPGIGCLGVGDALSAVVGTLYGSGQRGKWSHVLFGDSPASAVVRANPILRKKSVVGTVVGGFVLTFVTCAACIVVARFAADRMVGLPFSLANCFVVMPHHEPSPSSSSSSAFLATIKFWSKAAIVLATGSAFETVSGGVDNIEVPLLSMCAALLLF